MIFIIGLTYSVIAPLVLPFVVAFFGFGYLVMKYQLMYVYIPQYESGGRFWPKV
jgi:hypothetical protein